MKEIDPLAALRAFIQQHGTQREAAKALGISEPYLTDILQGNRKFSERILSQLNLKRVIVKGAA